jgi:hypothetical protein
MKSPVGNPGIIACSEVREILICTGLTVKLGKKVKKYPLIQSHSSPTLAANAAAMFIELVTSVQIC